MLALFVLVLAACGAKPAAPSLSLSGRTMASDWHVTVVEPRLAQPELQAGIQAILDGIEAQMTTYDEASALMQLNRAPLGEWVVVPADLFAVLQAAQEAWRFTDGAFDPTVGELVNLWGFGPAEAGEPPTADAIAAARARVGFQHVELDPQQRAVRKQRAVSIDLSAIAQGYAADRVADYLQAQGMPRYLVNISGEMRVQGHSPRGDAWRIAIEKPVLAQGTVQQALRLQAGALATSGDYRNFRVDNGRHYSHEIDPRTGQPAENRLASVTVIAADAARADALATGLMAMGEQRAMALAESAQLPLYLVLRDGENLQDWASPAFGPYLDRTGGE